MGVRYYDWHEKFTFSSTELEAKESEIKYSSNRLTTCEAMEYLGIGRCKIRKLIEDGELNPIVIRDRRNDKKFSYYFNLEELSIIRIGMIFDKKKKAIKGD